MDSIRRLIILRHAHAAKAEKGQKDYDRPLDARGLREAEATGREIARLDCVPAVVLCSGAARTRQTFAGLGDRFAAIDPLFDDTLYDGDAESYLAAARDAVGDGPLMLVGHNPSVAEAIALLSGDAESDAGRQLAEGVPPSAFALLEFDCPFHMLEPKAGFLRHFFRPDRR